MDIVYILGTGSRWNNNEIYYSMLSVAKHLKGFRDIYVIGEHPGFSGDFIHISHPDRFAKDVNICDKVLRACQIPELTDDFVFMNDDVFFLRDMDVKQIPDTFIGDLYPYSKKVASPLYRIVLSNTYNQLFLKGKPTKNFDGHMPIIYNKKLFPKAVKEYNWAVPQGLAVKSIYFNHYRITGEYQRDMKIGKPEQNIPALVSNRWCFSIGDNGLTKEMKEFISSSFEVVS